MVGFALLYVIFDDELGAVISKVLSHDLRIPEVVLKATTTTIFTMAIGIGEPEAEPETAIVPISISDAKGRVMVFSYAVDDTKARGGKRIESLMLFVERKYVNRFMKYSHPLEQVLMNLAMERLVTKISDENFQASFYDAQKIMLTEISVEIERGLRRICSENEIALLSDGSSIKGMYNAEISSETVELISKLQQRVDICLELISKEEGMKDQSLTNPTIETTTEIGDDSSNRSAFEIHCASLNQAGYVYGIPGLIGVIFSKAKGRIGRLMSPTRDLINRMELVSDDATKTSQLTAAIIEFNDKWKHARDPWGESIRKLADMVQKHKNSLDDYSIILASADRRVCVYTTNPQSILLHGNLSLCISALNNLSRGVAKANLDKIVPKYMQRCFLAVELPITFDTTILIIGESSQGIGFLKLLERELIKQIATENLSFTGLEF